MRKHKDYTRLINNVEWVRLRNLYLSQSPLCERCLDNGRTKLAEQVHHIDPIENHIGNFDKMKSVAYDIMNLQALCKDCHVQVHIELKSKSKEATKMRNKQKTESFIKKFL